MLKCRQLVFSFLMLCLVIGWQGPIWAADQNLPPITVTLEAADHGLVKELTAPAPLPPSDLLAPDWYWTISFLLPGLSQMMMEEPGHGTVFLAGFIGSAALVPMTLGVFLTQGQPQNSNQSVANTLSLVFTVLTAGFYVANLFDAYFLNQDKLTRQKKIQAAYQQSLQDSLQSLGGQGTPVGLAAHDQGIVSLDARLASF